MYENIVQKDMNKFYEGKKGIILFGQIYAKTVIVMY